MNRSDIIDLFLSYGCDINYHVIYHKSSSQPTMLHIATYMHNEELVSYLLEHSADPNINLPVLGTAIIQVFESHPLSVLNPFHVENRLNIFRKLIEKDSHLFEVNKGKYFFHNPINKIFNFLLEGGHNSSLKEVYEYLGEKCNISYDILDSIILSELVPIFSLATVKMLYNLGVKFEHAYEIDTILYVIIHKDETEILDFILEISQTAQKTVISLIENRKYVNISYKKELFCPILLKYELENVHKFCNNYNNKNTWPALIENTNDDHIQEQTENFDTKNVVSHQEGYVEVIIGASWTNESSGIS